jgi:hypothetical protein
MENDSIWEGCICNPHTPVQSKHTFRFRASARKVIQKVSRNGALGHPKSTQIKKKLHSKKHNKMYAKSSKK